MARKQPKPVNQMTIGQLEEMFPHEDACAAYLVARRWPQGVRCPRCGGGRVYDLKTMKWKWECPDCSPSGYRFSHLVGTVFENTNYPLKIWFRVIHMMLTSKKGVSALQIHRTIGTGSYRTAWYMCHRIRAGLHKGPEEQLAGIVEVDETFIGGKDTNKHRWQRQGRRGPKGKTPIAGAISRKGNVVARVIERADAATLQAFVREVVSHKVSLLATDDNHAYYELGKEYPHGYVKHSLGEYVHGHRRRE
jgi:transposase-like protein